MVTSRAGSRSRPATALAATGSGGETTAPSTAATAQGTPNAWATTVTRAAVPIVRPTARMRIARAAARSSLIEVAWVAAKSSGGSTRGRIKSGGRSGAGTPGRKPRAIPKTVSSTGCGTPIRSATGVRTTTPRTSKPNSTTASTVRCWERPAPTSTRRRSGAAPALGDSTVCGNARRTTLVQAEHSLASVAGPRRYAPTGASRCGATRYRPSRYPGRREPQSPSTGCAPGETWECGGSTFSRTQSPPDRRQESAGHLSAGHQYDSQGAPDRRMTAHVRLVDGQAGAAQGSPRPDRVRGDDQGHSGDTGCVAPEDDGLEHVRRPVRGVSGEGGGEQCQLPVEIAECRPGGDRHSGADDPHGHDHLRGRHRGHLHEPCGCAWKAPTNPFRGGAAPPARGEQL